MRGNCVAATGSKLPVQAAGGFMTVAGDPSANGYFVYMPYGQTVPSRWAVEVSNDNGSSWNPTGRCAWVTVQASVDAGSTWVQVGAEAAWLLDCTDGGLDLLAAADVAPEVLVPGAQLRVEFGSGRISMWLSIGFLLMPVCWFGAFVAAVLRKVCFKSCSQLTLVFIFLNFLV